MIISMFRIIYNLGKNDYLEIGISLVLAGTVNRQRSDTKSLSRGIVWVARSIAATVYFRGKLIHSTSQFQL